MGVIYDLNPLAIDTRLPCFNTAVESVIRKRGMEAALGLKVVWGDRSAITRVINQVTFDMHLGFHVVEDTVSGWEWQLYPGAGSRQISYVETDVLKEVSLHLVASGRVYPTHTWGYLKALPSTHYGPRGRRLFKRDNVIHESEYSGRFQ